MQGQRQSFSAVDAAMGGAKGPGMGGRHKADIQGTRVYGKITERAAGGRGARPEHVGHMNPAHPPLESPMK